jgi:endoglucanase
MLQNRRGWMTGISVLVVLIALMLAYRSWNGNALVPDVPQAPLSEPNRAADEDGQPPIIEAIARNQVGYLPKSDKVAVIVTSYKSPIDWELRSHSGGQVVLRGKTEVYGKDRDSGDSLHRADFSAAEREGTYELRVGTATSGPIAIGNDIYGTLPIEAMAYYYYHRLGVDLEAQWLADSRHARPALHANDERIACYSGWCEGTMNARYAWADAGDYGIYPVNHAFSSWMLLNLLDRDQHAFPDGSLSIPEQNNGIPDLLDEVIFGSTYMKGLLLPSDVLVTHKIHGEAWSVFPIPDAAAENRYHRTAQPPSTAATYAVARVAAQISRLLHAYDAIEADEWWAVAADAWDRAERLPVKLYTAATIDAPGGGNYEDEQISDDRYAAAVEMYLTAFRRNDAAVLADYRNAVRLSDGYGYIGDFDWEHTAAAGTLSLLTVENDLPRIELDGMRNKLEEQALLILRQLHREGYPSPIDVYAWGSNGEVLRKMMLLGHTHAITKDTQYLQGMFRSMDYILGTNALRLSFVTGYGYHAETDTHDRWAWNRFLAGVPFPSGWLSAGPNIANINDGATPKDAAAAKSYAAPGTAPTAWASKENSISLNAPLAWAAWYMHANGHFIASSSMPDRHNDEWTDSPDR